MNRFTASRLSDGNKMFPDEILIDETSVTIKSPRLFGGRATTFPLGQITVSVNSPFLGFCDLNFYANGTSVSVHGFTDSDAKNIKWLISNGGDFKRKKKIYDNDIEDEEDTDEDDTQDVGGELEEDIESLKKEIEEKDKLINRLRERIKEHNESDEEWLRAIEYWKNSYKLHLNIYVLLDELLESTLLFNNKIGDELKNRDELESLLISSKRNNIIVRETLKNITTNKTDELSKIIGELTAITKYKL